MQRARELEIEVLLLPEWHDVDTVADLERLLDDLKITSSPSSWNDLHGRARNTRQYLMARICRLAG